MSDRPSLSSLANLASSKKKTSSLASLASQAKPVSSLQSLAQRGSSVQKTTPSSNNSLSHLASRTNTLGSLASLAKKQPTKPALTHTPLQLVKPSPPPIAKPQVVVVKEEEEEEEEEEEIVENALIAKPSMAAQFLFQDLPMNRTSLKPVSSKISTIPVFGFNQPSPDDVVLAAQNQRTNNKKSL
ncbi:hypothetical protein EDC94DRAFT_200004 [Helicostylum pulchrum]|nr:hypothetical protein EDC94DRAFT_200004 [Helicostylum pulchrum]